MKCRYCGGELGTSLLLLPGASNFVPSTQVICQACLKKLARRRRENGGVYAHSSKYLK